ncbi:MAG TPA: YihY/virulence factor BrkB family protein, partial [Candidatus Acidoferrales bacterium]|nr:YihY/virulence factor BrkB family protein [Candidatus Acidoferrales bacterium]
MFRLWKNVFTRTFNDISQNHTMAFAAALSYYFILSLFPALIALAAVVGFLPIPNLFQQILEMMSHFVPAESMGVVRRIVRDVITPSKGALLSVGVIGMLWTASSGFASMIEALNVAYDVPETRPYWKTRSLALGLTALVGVLMLLALAAMIVGPRFGYWLAHMIHMQSVLGMLWPYIRWAASAAFVVAAVEALYLLGPNVRQRAKTTLFGAVIAVATWLALSWALGLYFQKFANFNKTYGVLGGAIALMTWLYYSSFVILIGAEINSEYIQETRHGKLPLKQAPPQEVTRKPATEADIAA